MLIGTRDSVASYSWWSNVRGKEWVCVKVARGENNMVDSSQHSAISEVDEVFVKVRDGSDEADPRL